MEDDSLDRLLAARAKETVPPAPGDLESRVWREIRARRARPDFRLLGWCTSLWNWQSHWQPVSVAVVVAVFIGVFMGRLESKGTLDSVAPAGSRTGDSLGLNVFSADPPAMPSTLLAQRP